MANELRVFQNLVGGRIDNNPLASGGTSLSSPELASLVAVSATQHIMLVLDPDGMHGAPEIVMVTAHTASATTATITRAQEGTSARAHPAGTDWVHAAVASDYESPWELVVDESGASIANWTSVAGTWSADAGGYLKQTDATAAYRGLRLTASVHGGAGLVAEAEVRFPTSALALRRTMLALGSTGAVGSFSDIWAGLQEGTTDAVIVQRGDLGALTGTQTVTEDQWYKLRVEQWMNVTTISVDGTRVFAVQAIPAIATNGVLADKFMLSCYAGEVHFRNIKVWRLSGPA